MRSLTARILLGASVLVVILGGVLRGLVVAVGSQRDAARRARGSEAAIATARLVERLVLDLRGYTLTGSDELLASHRRARLRLPQAADRLVGQRAADPAQAARAASIRVDAVAYGRAGGDPTATGSELPGKLDAFIRRRPRSPRHAERTPTPPPGGP